MTEAERWQSSLMTDALCRRNVTGGAVRLLQFTALVAARCCETLGPRPQLSHIRTICDVRGHAQISVEAISFGDSGGWGGCCRGLLRIYSGTIATTEFTHLARWNTHCRFEGSRKLKYI